MSHPVFSSALAVQLLDWMVVAVSSGYGFVAVYTYVSSEVCEGALVIFPLDAESVL